MKRVEKRAVFFDRDGTIIYDLGYLKDPKQVRLLPGAGEALSRLKREGFHLILVSNQSGVGRGLLTLEDVKRVHHRVVGLLAEHGAKLDGAYYCPHAPWDGCTCRKPSPEMFLQASEKLGLNLKRSFMIGDKVEDIEAGEHAGCQVILMDTNQLCHMTDPTPVCVAANWSEVVDYILSQPKET